MANGNRRQEPKPVGAIWRQVKDLDPELHGLSHEGARKAAARWASVRR